MSLDLTTVSKQILQMATDLKASHDDFLDRLRLARRLLAEWADRYEQLVAKAAAGAITWMPALPMEPLDACHGPGALPGMGQAPPVPAIDGEHTISAFTVVATDGSQIEPDRHSPVSFYLINVGSAVLTYGPEARAQLKSTPNLYYRHEDMVIRYGSEEYPVQGNRLDNLRTIAEIAQATDLAAQAVKDNGGSPVVVLQDNTLILWVLEESAERPLQEYFLSRYLAHMEALRSLGVPVAGYLSRPNSRDVVALLRLALCPQETPDCDACRGKHRQRQQPPCDALAQILDRQLFQLHPGQRSALFRSSSRVLRRYGPHSVCFFYLNIGQELARIEVPEWVAASQEMLSIVHAVAYQQAQNGRGYPTALARAHEQAVITAQEREWVESMMVNALLRQGLAAEVSEKGRSKQMRVI